MLRLIWLRFKLLMGLPEWLCAEGYADTAYKYSCTVSVTPARFWPKLKWLLNVCCARGGGAAWGYKSQGHGFPSSMSSFHFSLNQSFRNHYGSELDLSSNRNECQRYLLGDKGSRCIRMTRPPSCANCLGNLQPSNPGALRASSGLCKYSLINNFVKRFLHTISSL